MVRRISAMHGPFRLLAVTLLLWVAVVPIAPAQQVADETALILTGEVQIEAELFGVGSVVRPGDFCGVRLRLTDRGDRVRDSIVRLRLRDPDGDEALVQRPVTLNPGRPISLWLYAQLPPGFDPQSLLTVTVHEVDEGGAGRQIAAGRIAPQRVVSITDGLIAVMGRRGGGLEAYTVRDDSGTPTPTSHEIINVITGVTPDQAPDAWMGWAPFEALVWIDGDPTDLRADQAAALREWINRGGRLIVVLPSVGQLWLNSANPLIDIMPAMEVTRREDVNLELYRRLLTNRTNLPLPGRAVVHVFQPAPFADEQQAMPILAGPDGAPVVMRRLLGAGDVTVVGLDLGNASLTGRIDAQVIWHRLLGKRFDVRTRTEIAGTGNFSRLSPTRVDDVLAGMINKTGSAGVGVLLGLIVFALYFLLAGPVGFGLLSKWGARQHAWLIFVGVAAIFTVIAWGGATIIRPRTTDLTHITILDGVHGQNIVRARSWFSVLLPEYGASTIAIGDPHAPASSDSSVRHTLWPWQAPSPGTRTPFPDQRSYTIDARRPDTLRVPTRSTVKEFEARWMGPPPWRLPRPVERDLFIDANGSINGSIIHELPGALENVTIVLNRGQSPLVDVRDGGPLLANVWAWSPFGSASWAPGTALDLSTLHYRDADNGEAFFQSIRRTAELLANVAPGDTSLSNLDRSIRAINWFSAAEPPAWKTTTFGAGALRRASTHNLDLSRWLTQPSLIVVGQLSASETPIPVTVDGERPPSGGRTIVRWVYPLAPDPPRPTRDGAF